MSLLFAVAASAQWTAPTVSEFVDMAEDGATPQYLYNVGTKMFFAGHNDWNTRASVAEKGDSVRMQKLEADEEGKVYYTFGCYPATYVSKNNWLYVSANDWNAQWVDAPLGDGGYPGTANWIVTKSGDSYKFSNSYICDTYELDPAVATYGIAEHVWIKVSDDPVKWSNGENTRCYFYYQHQETVSLDEEDIDIDVFSGAFYDEWKFVSVETYNAYLEKQVVYAAAQSLKATIDKAKEENPGINLSEAEGVYNNTSSTIEDLQAAEASVAAAIVEFLKGKASAESPVNFTAKINNPDFGPDGSTPVLTGWDGDGWGSGGTTWSNAEVYGKPFDTYQKIGGLPQGVYMVACNGYTRYQSAQADYNAWKAGTPAETKIYFKSETNGMFSTPVKHVSAGGSVDYRIGEKGGVTEVTFKDEDDVEHKLYCPNHMASADDYFNDGTNRYRNEAYGALADGDTLQLGIVNSKATGSDWSIFDDFQLFYFGDGEDAYKLWANKAAEANEMEFTNPYGAPEKALYDEAINTLRNATNKDDIMQAIAAFNTIADTVAVSIANYAAYIKQLNDAVELLGVFEDGGIENDAVLDLTDYLQASASDNDEFEGKFPNGCANYILDLENGAIEGRLSAAEILQEIEFVKDLIAKCFNGMVAGSDVTGLLTNASFKEGFTGWTYNNGNVDWSCVEVYEKVVDCYQTVSSKPGVYAISVKGFVRPGWPDAITGDEDPLVYLYMNQFRTPVQNVLKDMIKESDAVDGVNAKVGDGGGGWPNDSKRVIIDEETGDEVNYFFPNSMEGAHYAFTANRYVQTCYGLVGEDGVLKIGLTSDGTPLPSGGWCLWADFKLTYMAKDPEALDAVINHYVPEVQALLEKDFGTPEKTKLQEVLTTAQESEDGETKYAALFELMDAMEAANASIKAYEAAGTALANLETALETYAETATPAAYEDATNVYSTYADIADYGYGLADVLEITDKLNAAVGKLKLPDYTKTPCDFTQVIENNSFETGTLDGWQYYKGGDTKAAEISNATYTIENADGAYVFNTWNGSAPSEGFWISQTLYGLPAGKYKLEALLASDKGSKISLAANDNAQEFTMENAKEIATDASIIFTLAEESNVTIKASSGSWFKADYFRLTYGPVTSDPEDVDGDGSVNITDVVKVINQIAAGVYDEAYDVDGNGSINITDIVIIINKIAGK